MSSDNKKSTAFIKNSAIIMINQISN